ncbi:hypothetical protein GCM10010244_03810 [Streptomyces coeruleorubidus]|nr:hypothetical protein GCM10010244_03810 [Streptomyces bellus]
MGAASAARAGSSLAAVERTTSVTTQGRWRTVTRWPGAGTDTPDVSGPTLVDCVVISLVPPAFTDIPPPVVVKV